MRRSGSLLILTALILSCSPARSLAQGQQAAGTLRGRVTYATTGEPIHNVGVQIVQLRLTGVTGDDGSYEFANVPPGTYTVVTHLEGIPDAARTVTVAPGAAAVADFALQLTDLREQVTVTASGIEESTAESFRSVNSVTSITLAEESHPSIGEVLEKEPGVAKRSFGPGSSRPVIRGFDGDRVLVLKDGVRTGSLGSQSGDHGEPIDVLQLERLEVVKGPATLLYGSNALGGVVNAVTRDEQSPHEGWRGYFTGLAGTTNTQAGVSAGFEYWHKGWAFWGSGSGVRTGDYDTPLGRVPNSKTRMTTAEGGFGYYGTRGFFSASYNHDQRRYGVPFASAFEPGEGEGEAAQEDEAEQIDLDMLRRNVRLSGGLRDLDSFVSSVRVNLDFTAYRHRELEGDLVGTTFDNDVNSYRVQFDQRNYKALAGRFGFEGFGRTYETVGAEALVKGPIDQKMFSVFGLEELDFERFKFQFGGRVETNRYRPTDPATPARDFTGFSGAAGVLFRVYPGGSLIANYTHSYRAPALEELYNFGPHVGNLSFEIGNSALTRERSDGFDFSYRHSTPRLRVDANVFYYNIRDFVFLAPVDEDGDGFVDVEDGLTVARYLQGDSRYTGADVGATFDLGEHVGVNLGADVVSARLRDGDVPLPRIPPMRARVGLDLRHGGFSVRPEAVFVRDQDALFPTETRTAGYTVFDLTGSYTVARPHFAHIFSVNAFNLGDKLYRNHLSFIKELAPEIGRGVRLTYTVRFF